MQTLCICVIALLIVGCTPPSSPTAHDQSLRRELIEAAEKSDSFQIEGFGNVKAVEDFFEPLNPETILAALESSSCINAPDNIRSQLIGRFSLLQGEREVARFDYYRGGRQLYKDRCLQQQHDPFFGCFN